MTATSSARGQDRALLTGDPIHIEQVHSQLGLETYEAWTNKADKHPY